MNGWKLHEAPTCFKLIRDGVVIATLAGPDSEENARLIQAAIDAPQPPALGEEPDVVGWRDDDGRCVTRQSGRYSDPVVRLEEHRAHVTRLQAEVEELRSSLKASRELSQAGVELERSLREQRDRLTARVAQLEAALEFYAEREHYHLESDDWDTVSGEPSNILWHSEEPDFIEDGFVARAALARGGDAQLLHAAPVLQALASVANGSIAHLGNGLCPDALEGHDSRDPDCPACQALMRFDGLARGEKP